MELVGVLLMRQLTVRERKERQTQRQRQDERVRVRREETVGERVVGNRREKIDY